MKDRFGDSFFKDLPKDPGVYTFIDSSGRPLYIGKADNLRRRLMSYQAAKPGQAPDHILEMIEHATDVKFELKKSGEDALRRETELIRSVRPPYNVALNHDVSYLYIALKVVKPSLHSKAEAASPVRVDFRLSHVEVKEGFSTFGCFRHRGKAKAAYSALMRLLFAAYCPRERFQLPSRICRSSPPYRYSTDVPVATTVHIENFLSGRDAHLLRHLLEALLAKDGLPKPLYLPLQRDLEILKQFFVYGPQDTARLAKRLRLKNGIIPQEAMDGLVALEFSQALAKPS